MDHSYNGSLMKRTKKTREKKKEEKLFNFDHKPALLEPWQVAEILGVTVRTVANYRLLGYFPAYYVSTRKHVYKTKDIEKFLKKTYKTDPF
jgi:hypothetical protein